MPTVSPKKCLATFIPVNNLPMTSDSPDMYFAACQAGCSTAGESLKGELDPCNLTPLTRAQRFLVEKPCSLIRAHLFRD